MGLALMVTSMVLVAGFSVLAFSAFQLNADLAMMMAVTIVFAIVADFMRLPPLLEVLENKESNHA